jgi:hypothetical protein
MLAPLESKILRDECAKLWKEFSDLYFSDASEYPEESDLSEDWEGYLSIHASDELKTAIKERDERIDAMVAEAKARGETILYG